MGKTSLRLSDIAKRCGDLSPLRAPITKVLTDGNREARLAGLDRHGHPLAPLAPRTIAHRKSAMGPADPHAPPLIPAGVLSRAISGYRVQVDAGPGRLRILAGWPDFPQMEYHVTGGPHLPQRDVLGFRPQDLDRCRGMMAPYVIKGKV